jgi:hypothetical protein
MVICSICVTPDVRGYVDADLVRHRSLRSISERRGLSIRSVRRHLLHLPELLEKGATSYPSIYIGAVTFNINGTAPLPEEVANVEEEEEEDVRDGGQEESGSIATEGGGGDA